MCNFAVYCYLLCLVFLQYSHNIIDLADLAPLKPYLIVKVTHEDFKKSKENVLYRKEEGTPEGLYL